MKEDTRNHWKFDNLGKLSNEGIRRVAANANYKGEAIISDDGVCTTLRAVNGCGVTIVVGYEE